MKDEHPERERPPRDPDPKDPPVHSDKARQPNPPQAPDHLPGQQYRG